MNLLTRTKISGILRFSIPVAFAVLGLLAIRARGAGPVGSIRGMVMDEQGAPLAGVKVQMCGLEKLQNGTWHRELRLDLMPSYTTDKEGRFVVPVNEADLRLDFYCDLPGYAPTFLDGITNNAPELKVVLKRGLTVTGTVKRMAGNKLSPVTGTQVELRLPTEDLWYQQRTMTDHNGNYMFHVSPPANGKKWQVVFAGEVVQLDVKEGQPVKGPDFEVTVTVKTSAVGINEADVMKIARQAVAKNDDWLDKAEFEPPQHHADGTGWAVIVWRLPKTPGGNRTIIVDEQGTVTSYIRGR